MLTVSSSGFPGVATTTREGTEESTWQNSHSSRHVVAALAVALVRKIGTRVR